MPTNPNSTPTEAYALRLIQRHCEEVTAQPVVHYHDADTGAQAAAYYALPEARRTEVNYGLFKTTLRHSLCPFAFEFYSSGDRLQELVKAGQLIVAEIARLWVLRHEQLVDVVPVDLHNECNWEAWQAAFLAAGRADGYTEEELVARNWQAVRQTQFSQGVLALDAYRACFPDPVTCWLQKP